MKLTILGGGGFRVPLVFQALTTGSPVTEVVLHDVAADRLAAIGAVLAEMAAAAPGAPVVRSTTDLDAALAGARFVFSAIRVDGLAGRTVDERVALDCGVLGQETTGPGGIAFGLRTVPVALRVAERVAAVAPDAWVVNFTNPAGMITEAMQRVLGERVVGICDSPVGLVNRALRALGLEPAEPVARLRRAQPSRLVARAARGRRGPAAGPARRRSPHWAASRRCGWSAPTGCARSARSPTSTCTTSTAHGRRSPRSARRRVRGGSSCSTQQERFYAEGTRTDALRRWTRVREERDATYMAESREAGGAGERAAEDVAAGGYQQVALDLMAALSGGPSRTMILNVRNGTAVPGLAGAAVVEVPCLVGPHGVTPLATTPLPGAMLGLLQQVKAVEQDTIEAAVTGSRALALRAFAQHPLVDSVGVAEDLLAGYTARLPGVAAVLAQAGPDRQGPLPPAPAGRPLRP